MLKSDIESAPSRASSPSQSASDSSEGTLDTPISSQGSVRPFSPKPSATLPEPFWPASLDDYEPNKQCPPLPPAFPQVPINRYLADVAAADVQTPDSWVKRNPELIRLTGKHPFNTEAPLTSLFSAGFLTPAHLHFVRNHGAVPRVFSSTPYADWTVRIHGIVEQEIRFTVQELAERFQVVTLPVTLVCAGNRRKEQNVVRKSLGFSWGAAGVSTALWTGVYLADVLAAVKPIRPQAKHVIFEGADILPNGPYGTSQRLSWASSRDKGMLLAWAMNGLPLEPDHGFPIRLIVPGQIGGRMVKWLTRVEVSEYESQHHLHFWDNKVLPMQLTPERAREERDWWYDPRYIITELNVNSAIAHPAHNESLDFTSLKQQQKYMIKGYSYAGGGRRISRVEVTLNAGESWELAEIEYPEDAFREECFDSAVYGTIDLTERDTCFCWCFWEFEVDVERLASASSIAVRAMDEGMNTQPRDMYLNATSMMNNWWFRVAIRKETIGDDLKLTFEHPTLAGANPGGWMERMKTEGKDILNPLFDSAFAAENSSISNQKDVFPGEDTSKPVSDREVMTRPDVTRKITVEELQLQDKKKPWFVVNGEVYDGTDYLKEHPGGADSIILVAGQDASEDFNAIHSADAKKKLAEYHIGTLVGSLSEPQVEVTEDTPSVPFLNPRTWKHVKLTHINPLNHDSVIYRFTLPFSEQSLGLPVGQHVFVRLKRKDTGEVVQRAYTPVSQHDAKGNIDFLIKLYLPNERFPSGGKMTVGFNQLEVGDEIELKGPLGSYIWQGAGSALWKGVPRSVIELGLVCAGSGITPILQVLRSILHDPFDTTRLSLIYANRTEADILCREELDSLLALHATGRLRVHYTLSAAPSGVPWIGGRGRITESMMKEHLPKPGKDCMVLVCGPAALISDTVRPGLERCGWDMENNFVVF